MKTPYSFFDMDVAKYMTPFKMPAVDVDAMMSAYRRNIEAMTAANQCAMEGVGALVRRQAEIAREGFESYTKAVGDLVAEGTVEEKATRQADMMRQAYDRAVSNARELGDMAMKTGNESFGVINDRIREGIGEVQDLVSTGAMRAAATVDDATAAAKDTMARTVQTVDATAKAGAPKK